MHLSHHIKAINALTDKLAKAEDKVGQYQVAIGQHIKAIKTARADDWEAIVKAECNLGRSRAYELLAIADGRKTVADVRAKTSQRQNKLLGKAVRYNGQKTDDPEASAEVMKRQLAVLDDPDAEQVPDEVNAFMREAFEFISDFSARLDAWRIEKQARIPIKGRDELVHALHQVANELHLAAQSFTMLDGKE